MSYLHLFFLLTTVPTILSHPSPCRLHHPRSSTPLIRVLDDTQTILGKNAYASYDLISQPPPMIECSSPMGKVSWTYEGRGASSGVKLISTTWSNKKLKTICYSSTIVFINVTDQLVGRWSCGVNNLESENSFVLFVPQPITFYPLEGELIKITVASTSESVTIPCISKKRWASGLKVFVKNETDDEELLNNLHYDPFSGYRFSLWKELFHGNKATFVCRFGENVQNETLVTVEVKLRDDELIAPIPTPTPIYSFSPYFSWTSKSRPEISLQTSSPVNTLEWQQLYIKGDYEQEGNSSGSIFHLGSFQVLSGDEGKVELKTDSSHEWNWVVLEKEKEPFVGLSYDVHGNQHVFTCVSGTNSIPNITFKSLTNDESGENYSLTPCPTHPLSLGCIMLTSTLPFGKVSCEGDGISEVIRYPLSIPFSRPYFIERGASIELMTVDHANRTIPCASNNKDSIVYLFKSDEENNWSLIYDGFNNLEEGWMFYPHVGFVMDTGNLEWDNFHGNYLCTSSMDLEDYSDAVTVEAKNYTYLPQQSQITVSLPYLLKWAWSSETDAITVNEEQLTNFINITTNINWMTAELILTEEMFTENELNVTLSRGGGIIHEWRITLVTIEEKLGLTVTTGGSDSWIEIICRGSKTEVERDTAKLTYYTCINNDTCNIMENCERKDCLEVTNQESSSCLVKNGCLRRFLKSFPLNGYLNVVCSFNGITEKRSIFDVFFREDMETNHLSFLSANAASSESNPSKEIVDLGSNLEFDIGDSVVFSCGASPAHSYHGIRWGWENLQEHINIQSDDPYDPQWKYTSPTQLLSTFNFHIKNFDIKRIWCFIPQENGWKNLSQIIFVRGEISETCHETEPSLRLLNIYPSPSQLNFSLTSVRLDKTGQFIAPKGLLQFSVIATATEPIEWHFTGVDGPSLTPSIQNDRLIRKEELVVNVVQKKPPSALLEHKLLGNVHIFTCKSGSDTKPNLTLSEGLSFQNKDCVGKGCSIITTNVANGTVICYGDDVMETMEFRQESDGGSLEKNGIWYDSEINGFKCRIKNSSEEMNAVTCRRPNECAIMMEKLKLRGIKTNQVKKSCGVECTQLEMQNKNWFTIFIQCNELFMQFFHHKGIIQAGSIETMKSMKKINLDVTSFQKRNEITISAKLRCFANRYFYSRGIVWGLEKKDGTMEFKLPSEMELQSQNLIMSELQLEELDLTKIWCFVPILNSQKYFSIQTIFSLHYFLFFARTTPKYRTKYKVINIGQNPDRPTRHDIHTSRRTPLGQPPNHHRPNYGTTSRHVKNNPPHPMAKG
ncbi:hypothetical protein Fcan01_27784 [Folsomia candida]|uniref:Ig-like domain-containing protein n=1 Tax=Folsomia candida TaxID=158441 RepID=A0A226CY39_FOLCA|nr:hypothetical protein Fcan01_27784 [Folsomia candida]